MIYFTLGYIVGIATCAFVAVVLAYFRRPIIQALGNAETKLANAGHRLKGHVFEPESEADLARKAHIKRNAEQGKDTPISELQ